MGRRSYLNFKEVACLTSWVDTTRSTLNFLTLLVLMQYG